jgi:hypothetical protein
LENTNVYPVPLELLDHFWGRVAPLLQKAIERGAGELELGDVYQRLQDRHMQLLVAVEGPTILAAFVTEVVQYPRKRALRVVLAGGTGAKKWKGALRAMLHTGARAVGAKSLEVLGRPGWVRFLRDLPTVKLKYHVLVEDI